MGKLPIHYLTSKNETIIKNLRRMLNRKTSRAQWISEGEAPAQPSSPQVASNEAFSPTEVPRIVIINEDEAANEEGAYQTPQQKSDAKEDATKESREKEEEEEEKDEIAELPVQKNLTSLKKRGMKKVLS